MQRPIGRETEIEWARRALERPGAVMLVGPPGVGKSTLARWVVRDREALWVDLEPVGPQGLDAALARGLDVPLTHEAIVGGLSEIRTLVLDGAEGLVEQVGIWLSEVRDEVSELRLLVTSRMRARGFDVLEVAPLSNEAAEQLFLEEAERVCAGVSLDAETAAIAELVRRLDGLPLAVALAASKLRLYSPTELLAEEPLDVLRDRRLDGRHNSLANALQVSWNLLDDDARVALTRIAQVRRWFGRRAFEEITGAPAAKLRELIDASLVRRAEGEGRERFHLLEPIRAFALARLPEDDPARERYLEGVLARAEGAMARLNTADGRTAVEQLRDLTADLDGVVDLGGDRAARAVHTLAALSSVAGGMLEVSERVAALDTSTMSPLWKGRTRLLHADLLVRLRRSDAALRVIETLPDDPELDNLRGVIAMRSGDPTAALEHLTRAMARIDAGEPSISGTSPEERRVETLVALAATHMERGAFEDAIRACEEGLSYSVGRRDLEGLMLRCTATAGRLVSHAELPAALEKLERAVHDFRQIHHQRYEARTLVSLAVLESDLGQPTAAERVDQALPLLKRTGEAFLLDRMQILRGIIELDRGDLDAAEACFDRCHPPSPKNRATLDCYRGVLMLLRGDTSAGVRVLEDGQAGFARLGMEVDRDMVAHYLAVARAEPPPIEHGGRSHNLEIANQIVKLRAQGRPLTSDLLRHADNELDLRLLMRLTRLAGATEVARDGSWFRTDDGRVELGRKRVLRRVLRVFAENAGKPLTTDELLAGAWPGERTAGNSGRARVHVAVSELRKLGLRDALQTAPVDGGSGYCLTARILA